MRISDWSSDVCSSDLLTAAAFAAADVQDATDRITAGHGIGKRQTGVFRMDQLDATTGTGVEDIVEAGGILSGQRSRRTHRQSQDAPFELAVLDAPLDRKSTRLNSSH